MYHILTDSSANLPAGFLKKHDIGVIPFILNIGKEGEQTYTHPEAFDRRDFYGLIRKGVKVSASQISPQRYMEYFEPYLAAGEDIVFIAMSSGVSASYFSALSAADNLKGRFPDREIHVVDSLSVSLGQGLLTAAAAKQRERGKSAGEAADFVSEYRRRLYQVFTVDNPAYLRHAGKCPGLRAASLNVPNIRPILKVGEKGRIVVSGKARGRKESIEALAETYEALAESPERQTIGISHADCPREARYLISLLQKNKPPKKILTVCFEPVTGSGVGPGALSLFFFGGPDVRGR